MHATIPQPELAAAVSWAARQLPARPTNPVLTGLRLTAADGQLRVEAWDGTTAAHATLTADIAEPGTVIAPGQMLNQVIGALRKSDVTLAGRNAELEVTTLGAHFALNVLDGRDYPTLPAIPAAQGSVDGTEFAAAYKRVKAAIDPKADGTFAGMSGIRIRVDSDILALTATDRYRIATATVPWQAEQSAAAMGVLPGKVFADNAGAFQGRLHLSLPADGAGTAALSGDGRQVSTMLIDPHLFPHKLDELILTKTGRIVCTAEDLAEGVRAAMAVSEAGKPVWVNASEAGVSLRAGQTSRSVIELDATYESENDGFEAAINSVYLLDGLGPLTGLTHIDVTTPKTPAVIHSPDDPTYRYIVTPLREPEST
ncbi:DNA polymerase III subunit beta [Streptomyces goshikiensis]|uniref:DNA polymerase III subunit beta n=1 Tax=Streptomyces goshikiensis TaxID=1942 RepID=UPI0036BD30A6